MSKSLKAVSPILSCSKLLRSDPFINGTWVKCKKTFPVYSPSTGEHLIDVGDVEEEHVQLAIDAAANSLKDWSMLSGKERGALLITFYENVMIHKEPLAQIMSAECGRPIKKTRLEVDYGASFLQWFAEESKRIYGDMIPAPSNSSRRFVLKRPVGVVGLITPWNFPLAMITRKLGAAMAAGCTSVIKPSEETPLTALALAAIAEESGIPAGVINVLTCSSESTPMVGDLLCDSQIVRKISFTGSTATGKLLLKKSASSVKRMSLELGGNAPFIVFNSADIDLVVRAALSAKFRANGQTCIAATRFLIQDGVHQNFIQEMTKAVKSLVVGDPFDQGTDVSSLINEKGMKKVETHVQDAISKGALPLVGCERHRLGPNFYKPSIIDGCDETMLVMKEETFGPVISVMKFHSEEDAIRIANNSKYGLAGYVFSQDIAQIVRLSENIEVGMLGVNDGAISSEMIPFGGIKESGIGREGSKYGIDEYLDLKFVSLGGLKSSL
ncbi:succinate-semialdehyde dehydrogenase, mitochondrial-like isoform X3 [Rhopilema esculentum]|eukprot:gene16519-7941_t